MAKLKEMRPGEIIFSIVQYVMLIGASLVALIPVVVCVFTAFKTDAEYQSTTPLTLPNTFAYFDNFVQAFTMSMPARKCRFSPKRNVIFRRTVYKCIQP